MIKIYILLCGALLWSLYGCRIASNIPTETMELFTIPQSMKGYELYSWQTENIWKYTIITGTNRNKNIEEIITKGNTMNPDGWVKITVINIPDLKIVLKEIPQGEFITWLSYKYTDQSKEKNIKLILPPKEIIENIKEYCRGIGLNLTVPE